MAKKKQQTVGDVLVRTMGFRRASVIAAYIGLWSLFRAVHDRDPARVEELADEIERDRSTVFRWQEDFRICFPQWSTPGDLLDAVSAHKTVTPRGAMRLVIA